MLKYKDFVPREIQPPGVFDEGEHESFDDAVRAANAWLVETRVKLVNLETVVLPNIWSRWEDGSQDASIASGGDHVSRWHQFLRCWYQDPEGRA